MILLPVVLAGLFALSTCTFLIARALRRDTGYVLAAAFAASAAAFAIQTGDVAGGRALEWSASWVPSLGLRFSLVLDGLALLFALIILGVGAAVMAYSARYFKPEDDTGRIYALLTAFAASMLGLVLAGDVILMYVFWELTSITSFFLIGGGGRGAAEARRAFLVTGLGGLSLLAGVLLMASVAGSTEISEMIAGATAITNSAAAPWIVVLLLIGAFTKSAQVPFHFWLPGAMVAPTPVSTYLHAATMVKAGLYLLARFTPVFGGEPLWFYPIVFVGLTTALTGAVLALKQHDLKALLAYSTVSQLGWLTALIGIGTFGAITAASVHLAAHALYKATLFMITGIIDREAGSRDIRELSGLYRAMPITAATMGVAALSMAGFPPLLGFISKEESFTAFLGAPGAEWLAPAVAGVAVVAASVTFAYGARIFDEAFTGPLRQPLYEPRISFLWPAAVTAFAGLGFGIASRAIDGLALRAATEAAPVPPEIGHIALWHGFTPALGMSLLTILGGTLLFAARAPVGGRLARVRLRSPGAVAFDRIHDLMVASGKKAAAPFLSSVPAVQFAWIFAALAAAGAGAAAFGPALPEEAPPPSEVADWFVVVLLMVVCVGIARARARLAAVALLGLTGFLVTVFYVLLGAPDLALTQVLVETLTVALVVLVFRRLPREFHPVARLRRRFAAIVAVAAGAAAFAGSYTLLGRREASEVGEYLLRAGPEDAGGNNVVNTILVDFRALDTFGEITVLSMAAVGVYVLVLHTRQTERK